MKTYILLLIAAIFASCNGPSNSEIVTATGLKYVILKEGNGNSAKEGDNILMHESLRYPSGQKMYSTKEMGNPIKILVGSRQAIAGVDEGLLGMKVGEVRQLIVPPALSKRTEYPAFLSPDSTLVYEIELVEILK